MTTHHRVVSDTYHDSVQLMRIASDVAASMPVDDAEAVMGTPANRQTLVDSGRLAESELADIGNDDLVLVATAADRADAEAAVEEMAAALERSTGSDAAGERKEISPKSIRQANETAPAGLALVSVPGEYAAREAWKALHEGLHVHVFSDNVELEDERELKAYAHENDRLMMGPDCGSAIVDGLPLGFTNEVPDGNVGIVSASGTGLQAVASRIGRRGGGISQAIGTGGRDLSEEVKGLTTRTAVARLDEDEATEVIVLISKPPAERAIEAVLDTVDDCSTPVIAHFQGVDADFDGLYTSETLAATADRALDAVGIEASEAEQTVDRRAFDAAVDDLDPTRKRVRGLFTGGTLCSEAALELGRTVESVRSNVGIGEALSDPLSPNGNAFVDFGTDELTSGRPHPMIDPSLRNEHLGAALRDETVGVVLLDVVLGHGAHSDPAGTVAEVVSEADTEVPVVASVCGTAADPQDRNAQIRTLEEAGVYVAESNVAAARLAARAVDALGGEQLQEGSA